MYKAKTNIWGRDYTDNLQKITNYIENKRDKMSKIRKYYNQTKEVMRKFVDITKDYSNNIVSIAMTLLPNSETVEGKLIQSIQSILLFNSENLIKLINDISYIYKAFKAGHETNGLNDFSIIYQTSFSNVVKLYSEYIDESETYEKYLIHKELGILDKEYKKNNQISEKQVKNLGFDIIDKDDRNIDEEKGKKKEKSKTKEKLLKKTTFTPQTIPKVVLSDESLYDNHQKIIDYEKEYLKNVGETNRLIKKLIEFGWNEERLLKTDFYNNCKNFIDKLLDCLNRQKTEYENQLTVIRELNEIIKSEKIELFYLEAQKYALHSLSIYMNNRAFQSMKINKNDNQTIGKDDFEIDIYKNLNIEIIGNIIKEMQKNNLEVKKEDLENYEREKNLFLIEKNTKLIFENDSDLDFTDDDLNKMIEIFKNDKEYILFFLQRLNNDRSRGGLISSMKIYKRVGELFNLINDLVLEKNDLDCFKYISILSMTYYRNNGNDKIYIYEYIKDHHSFKNLDFWKKYLEALIKYDLNNTIYTNENEIIDNKENKEKEMQFKLNFASFSNILSIINNLTDFGLGKNFIKQFIDFTNKNYSLSEDQKQQINCLLNLYEEKGTSDTKINKNEDLHTNKILFLNNNKIKNKEENKDYNFEEKEENNDNNGINLSLKEENSNNYINDNQQNTIEQKPKEIIENGFNVNNDE